jgi:hypothetical protein
MRTWWVLHSGILQTAQPGVQMAQPSVWQTPQVTVLRVPRPQEGQLRRQLRQ